MWKTKFIFDPFQLKHVRKETKHENFNTKQLQNHFFMNKNSTCSLINSGI